MALQKNQNTCTNNPINSARLKRKSYIPTHFTPSRNNFSGDSGGGKEGCQQGGGGARCPELVVQGNTPNLTS